MLTWLVGTSARCWYWCGWYHCEAPGTGVVDTIVRPLVLVWLVPVSGPGTGAIGTSVRPLVQVQLGANGQ